MTIVDLLAVDLDAPPPAPASRSITLALEATIRRGHRYAAVPAEWADRLDEEHDFPADRCWDTCHDSSCDVWLICLLERGHDGDCPWLELLGAGESPAPPGRPDRPPRPPRRPRPRASSGHAAGIAARVTTIAGTVWTGVCAPCEGLDHAAHHPTFAVLRAHQHFPLDQSSTPATATCVCPCAGDVAGTGYARAVGVLRVEAVPGVAT